MVRSPYELPLYTHCSNFHSLPSLHLSHCIQCILVFYHWFGLVSHCMSVCPCMYIFCDRLSFVASFPFIMPVLCAQSFRCVHCTIIHLSPKNQVIFHHYLKHICWFQTLWINEVLKYYLSAHAIILKCGSHINRHCLLSDTTTPFHSFMSTDVEIVILWWHSVPVKLQLSYYRI